MAVTDVWPTVSEISLVVALDDGSIVSMVGDAGASGTTVSDVDGRLGQVERGVAGGPVLRGRRGIPVKAQDLAADERSPSADDADHRGDGDQRDQPGQDRTVLCRPRAPPRPLVVSSAIVTDSSPDSNPVRTRAAR